VNTGEREARTKSQKEEFQDRLVSLAFYAKAQILCGVHASTAALLAVFDMQPGPGETHLVPSLE
jgi:hypothetical protein